VTQINRSTQTELPEGHDYLTALQTHAAALARDPDQWMPWNYRDTLAQLDSS
jgi:hypothetical protein